MSSTFGGLQGALSALVAQQRGLDTTGQNIANSSTVGYSRQRVDLVADAGPSAPALFSTWSGGGGGVKVADISRINDAFLQVRSTLEHAASHQLSVTNGILSGLERVFGEPSDTGIQQTLSDFWSGWDEVANNPGDPAARTQLLQRADVLVNTLNEAARDFDAMREATSDQLGAAIDQVNTIAGNVAKLNDAIQVAASSGLPHNDLLDQRDLLVSQLSDLVGVSVRAGANDTVDVFINGGALVRGSASDRLAVDQTSSVTHVVWAGTGATVDPTGGDVGGRLAALNDVMPRYRTLLDGVANRLVTDVNAFHGAIAGSLPVGSQDQSAAGPLTFRAALNGGAFADVTVTGADWSGATGASDLQTALQQSVDTALGTGVATVSVTGGNGSALAISLQPTNPGAEITVQAAPGNAGLASFLGATALGLDGVGGRAFFTGAAAGDIAVSSEVASDGDAIGAGIASGGALDTSVARHISELANAAAGADTAYRDLVVGLGVETQSVARRSEIQDATTGQVDSALKSVSGVDIDEEMVKLVQFQHAYNAAARMISVLDDVLDTLIRHTGT
jgi:flagellar hook-associated protein FlgK